MQKYILSLIILAFSSQIFSQKLSFSVVVDPMITWMKTNEEAIQRDGVNFGYNIGLVMDKYFTDDYAISTGISILNTGGNLLYLDSMDFNFGFFFIYTCAPPHMYLEELLGFNSFSGFNSNISAPVASWMASATNFVFPVRE